MRVAPLRVAWFVALLTLASCGRSHVAFERLPNVVLIVIDTMRADRVGWLGGDRGVTPFLDRLAAEGAIFTRAYAQAPETRAAVASLMTSRYPRQHGVLDFGINLPPSERTLAEVLHGHGYATGGFSANPLILDANGYGQGFDHYYSAPLHQTGTKIRAERINEKALAWVDSRAGDAPLFLYVQYMEPHLPYSPPSADLDALLTARGRSAAWRSASFGFVSGDRGRILSATPELSAAEREEIAALQDVYDAEVRAVDTAIEALLAALRERGVLDPAVVIVTADHGEEFAEHVRVGHGGFLFEQAVHIPLLVAARGHIGPRRIDGVVSQVDIAPTLLALLGLGPEPAFEGRTVADRLTEPAWRAWLADRWESLQARWGGDAPGALITEPRTRPWGRMPRHDQALVVGTQKVIVDRTGSLQGYDLAVDPNEIARIFLDEKRRAALASRLVNMRNTLATRAAPKRSESALSEEQRAGLRALGYLADEK